MPTREEIEDRQADEVHAPVWVTIVLYVLAVLVALFGVYTRSVMRRHDEPPHAGVHAPVELTPRD